MFNIARLDLNESIERFWKNLHYKYIIFQSYAN